MNTTFSSTLDTLAQHEDGPRIICEPIGLTIEEDADAIRWRAWWKPSYSPGRHLSGVTLHAYPVIRRTHRGAWIDPHAYPRTASWDEGRAVYEWETSDTGKRWVSDEGAQAWAKPTKAEALQSLAVRLERWTRHIARDVKKAREAAEIARDVLDASYYADAALANLKSAEV